MTWHEVQEILLQLSYKDWLFGISNREDALAIRVSFWDGNEDAVQHGRWWRISEHATRSEVVNTCLLAVLTAEEHEAREKFRYKGAMIYGPHIDVEWLVQEVKKKEHLDLRESR